MLSLCERSPYRGTHAFTEFQNSAAFKSYSILKFGKLVGSLIEKAEIEFADVLRISELLLHLESNLAEI